MSGEKILNRQDYLSRATFSDSTVSDTSNGLSLFTGSSSEGGVKQTRNYGSISQTLNMTDSPFSPNDTPVIDRVSASSSRRSSRSNSSREETSVSPTVISREASTSIPDDNFDTLGVAGPSGSAQKQTIPFMSRNVRFSSPSPHPNTTKHHQSFLNPETDSQLSYPSKYTSNGILARDFADVNADTKIKETSEPKLSLHKLRNTSNSIWGNLLTINPSSTLENTGSVARDHLASERTFLAYVRTSLAVASAGVALVQLFTIAMNQPQTNSGPNKSSNHIQRFARPLGATTVLLGFLVLVIGCLRYFSIQKALIDGKFPPAKILVTMLGSALALVVAIVFSVLVAVPR